MHMKMPGTYGCTKQQASDAQDLSLHAAPAPAPAGAARPVLTLHRASSFRSRLLGLHATGVLPWHTGLYLSPCNAIHTIGLRYAIDVVFMDEGFWVARQIKALPPNRIAYCRHASSVVELPAGYCAAYPDYASIIQKILK